jgi:hypothetical protein
VRRLVTRLHLFSTLNVFYFDLDDDLLCPFDHKEGFSTMKLEAATPVFQEKTVPPGARLAGWAALVHALGVGAPVRRPSGVSDQHVKGSRRAEGAWVVFDKRYWPGESFGGHHRSEPGSDDRRQVA